MKDDYTKAKRCKNCLYAEPYTEVGFHYCTKLKTVFPGYVLREKETEPKLLVPDNFTCPYFKPTV